MSAAGAWQLKQCSRTAPPRPARVFSRHPTDSEGEWSVCRGQLAMKASGPRGRMLCPAACRASRTWSKAVPGRASLVCAGHYGVSLSMTVCTTA